VRVAAERAGRDPDTIEIAQSLIVSIDDDATLARDAVRPMIAIYLSQFPNIARESDVPAAELDRIAGLMSAGGPEVAAAAIGDELVAELACAGTPADCRRQLAERRACGIELPVISIVHGPLPDILPSLLEESVGNPS
jgi:5,10-methylenetetrahydromethanopterin reductase